MSHSFVNGYAAIPHTFVCLTHAADAFELYQGKGVLADTPDVVDGAFGVSPVSFVILNTSPVDWLTNLSVTVKTVQASAGVTVLKDGHDDIGLSVAPGQLLSVGVKIALDTAKAKEDWHLGTDGDSPCVRFVIHVQASGDSKSVNFGLRCRRQEQSWVFTFFDHDGSVAHAAVIFPLSPCEDRGCGVLMSLSGVGVGARDAADAYKYEASTSSGLKKWVIHRCVNCSAVPVNNFTLCRCLATKKATYLLLRYCRLCMSNLFWYAFVRINFRRDKGPTTGRGLVRFQHKLHLRRCRVL